jgi:hypothetical protein
MQTFLAGQLLRQRDRAQNMRGDQNSRPTYCASRPADGFEASGEPGLLFLGEDERGEKYTRTAMDRKVACFAS